MKFPSIRIEGAILAADILDKIEGGEQYLKQLACWVGVAQRRNAASLNDALEKAKCRSRAINAKSVSAT